ncbi:SDR family oxidoreductase [Aquamicrobium terrae]|uniref:3-oxoacyl-[acyl-carrier protein] reductase n=1 Tax=Aquamicrobium terrae TaxID=1324945 RepID=A0ABV2N7E0_9HYPH
MDLGIDGRRALVCASSAGLGKACAVALAREGCDVTINGRSEERLRKAREDILLKTGRTVRTIVADLNVETERTALMAACSDLDILVNNNKGPEPGSYTGWSRDDWLAAVEANMLAPIFLIRQCLPGMRDRKFGRIVNITSARVKTPTARMAISSAPRAALTAFSKAVSVEAIADNVTLNNLLPERIDTDRQHYMAQRMVEERGGSLAEARQRIGASVPAKRMGTPEEFGDACAYLCSRQAGFITGQNIHVDGGSYAGLI